MTSGTDLRFGEELRRERLVRGITLEEVSAATKISIRVLQALERSDLARLPAPAFTRGFIRSYALHIGIEPEEKVCAYLSDLKEQASGRAPAAIRGGRKFWRGRSATAGTIVGGVTVLLLLMGLIVKPERRPVLRAEKPPAARSSRMTLKNVTVSSEPTPAVRQPEPEPPPAASPAGEPEGKVSLLLEFNQDSWTELEASGETLLVGLIRKGEVKRFEARGGYRLSLGNAGGVRVTLDGYALESLGREGQIVRNLALLLPAARG